MKRVDEYITEKDAKSFVGIVVNCAAGIALYGVKLRMNIMKMKEKGEKKNASS